MSGTDGSLTRRAFPSGLPVPKVRLVNRRIAALSAPLMVSEVPINNSAAPPFFAPVTVMSIPQVIVTSIPEFLFDPAFGLQVELGRWRRRLTVSAGQPNFGGAAHASHMVHPSTKFAPGGSWTHGGEHMARGGFPVPIAANRVTEFPALGNGQVITGLETAMAAFMELRVVLYRPTGSVSSLFTASQSVICAGGSYRKGVGRSQRFPYNGSLQPGRFAFRYSIIDPSDPRGQRMVGGWSEEIQMTNAQFPFNWDAPATGPYPTCSVRGGFEPTDLRCFFGERVPSAV